MMTNLLDIVESLHEFVKQFSNDSFKTWQKKEEEREQLLAKIAAAKLPTGTPVYLPRHRMTIAPGHPLKEAFDKIQERDEEEDKWQYVNSWFSEKTKRYVLISKHKDTNKVRYSVFTDLSERLEILRNTLATVTWTVESEFKALEKLKSLITPYQFKKYFLAGYLPETSERSGVNYIFRKSRPTLAMKGKYILCALCLHPIGYYQSSFNGALCPTDEVIDHLLRMRGDEISYWKKAEQHPISHPQAGI